MRLASSPIVTCSARKITLGPRHDKSGAGKNVVMMGWGRRWGRGQRRGRCGVELDWEFLDRKPAQAHLRTRATTHRYTMMLMIPPLAVVSVTTSSADRYKMTMTAPR
jgi:hypothetical protein